MSVHQYGSGFNVALASLTEATPLHPPRSGEIVNADIVQAVSGRSFPRGFNLARWQWRFLTFEEHDTLMTGLGLSLDVTSAEVTIYTALNTATAGVQDWARFNALARFKSRTRAQGKAWLDLVIEFALLEQLSEP